MPYDDLLTSLPPHETATYLESLLKLANNVFKSTLSWSDLEYYGKTLHSSLCLLRYYWYSF